MKIAERRPGLLLGGSVAAVAALVGVGLTLGVPEPQGCGGADPGAADSLDSLDDGKSDRAAATAALLDGAKRRIYAKLSTLSSSSLLAHLTQAAHRGLDVRVYLVMTRPGDGQTVLDEQGLEASGVDVTVVRTDGLVGFTLLVDDRYTSGGKTSTDAPTASGAAKKFAAAVAEPAGSGHGAADGVRLLTMPDVTGADVVAALNGARQSIDLELYQGGDPATLDALLAAARRGVKVRAMLEPHTVGAANYSIVADALTAAGATVQPTPPQFDGSHNVDHAKFMILDGHELLFGTGNLVRSGLGGNPAQEFDNRDFWIVDGRGPAVAEAAQLFEADWQRHPSTGIHFANLVVTPDNAATKIRALIDGAQQTVRVYNQSLSDQAIVDALVAAKRRGADVAVLLGYQPGFGGSAPKNDAALQQLKAAGIAAGYLTRHYLHAKVVVADGQAFVGSQNFTGGGLGSNREVGEIVAEPSVVSELRATFDADQKHPAP
jgi:phosphatidylserine/phosphatidylglycerophosphate/cardiolipin synthase-like enzyme